jgi:hypothetical protein
MSAQAIDDVPWTAKVPPWVTVLVVIVTGGYALMFLGIYLAAWVRTRRRRGYSLAIYILCTLLIILPFGPLHSHVAQTVLDGLALGAFVLAPFTLRYDIQRYLVERQNSKVEMNPFWTLFFGAAYINYCLAIVFSGYGEPHKEVIGLAR